jgi:hypothetical protein
MKKHSPSYETQELREFAEVLRGRRTIELFLQTPVPDELVREAITWAPNHHVTEPWRFILPGEQTVQKILDLCQRIVTDEKGAELALHKRESWGEKPGWLMVTCERSDDELRRLFDIIGVDDSTAFVVGLIWFGYPKLTPTQSRKRLDEVLVLLP